MFTVNENRLAFMINMSSFILRTMRPVVIVMVKAPRPGLVKTRLSPPLQPAEAASLARCFIEDVVSSALSVSPNVIVAFTPANERTMMEGFLPSSVGWLEQQGHDLGERLISAIAYAHNLGFGPIIVLGVDSPTLPPSLIDEAFHDLSSGPADVALGPTADGGYYLVGVRKPEPLIFQNVIWSSPHTFAQTARNVRLLKLRLLTLAQWYDVDTFDDLKCLDNELRSDEDARVRAPKTWEWLSAHRSIFLPSD